MTTHEELRYRLERIDGKGYKAYREIEGTYDFRDFILSIDHVQGDPFASPSRVRIILEDELESFPERLWQTGVARCALADYLTLAFARAIRRNCRLSRGTGKSGLIAVDTPGQQILERTSVTFSGKDVEVRVVMGLPAAGRRVLARQAAEMFFDELPRCVREIRFRNLDAERLLRQVELVEDQESIRESLSQKGLVAFVGNGSLLPRESGVSDRPLRGGVPFNAPPSLEVELRVPNRGLVKGMGVPLGVTLIVGGGYHGKSTLLRALEKGIYNHRHGDGREWVITAGDAVKIRAEDGRRVEKVNISPFINNLPQKKDTRRFSTDSASGSTSQAANIIEALEAGTSLLLLDEDTSATNFMIRDSRMMALVSREKEPITPFIERIRQLYEEKGVSTVLVAGGSGDYFAVADTVIMLDEYRPIDVTLQAHRLAGDLVRENGEPEDADWSSDRVPDPASLDPRKGKKKKVVGRGTDEVTFGFESIDLSAVEQIVSPSQTRAIAESLDYALRKGYIDGRRTLGEVLDMLEADIEHEGLLAISPFKSGDLARPRRQEIAAAINRLRTLSVRVGG